MPLVVPCQRIRRIEDDSRLENKSRDIHRRQLRDNRIRLACQHLSDLLCLWPMNVCSVWGTWCACIYLVYSAWTYGVMYNKGICTSGTAMYKYILFVLVSLLLRDVRADTFHQCLQHHQQLEWSCMYFSGSRVPHISILFSLTSLISFIRPPPPLPFPPPLLFIPSSSLL